MSCAGAAIVLVHVGQAAGTTYYWDTNGTVAGRGSAVPSANWLSNMWATLDTGTAAVGAWPNAAANADVAVFGGTSGTVNVAATDVFANVIRFDTANYTIANTGAGALRLAGVNPTVNVSLPGSGNVVTISAPIAGSAFTLDGNSLTGGLKFLVLANPITATRPNTFAGTLTVNAGGALRLGGGAANEQIPDACDLAIAGVLDFVTAGSAADGKQERVRNATVSGANANFSIGNGANFVVNSLTATNTTGPGVALNGNNATNPTRLTINGWSSGSARLNLDGGSVRLNTTGATSAIGSIVLLSGDIQSSGTSVITNANGAAASVNANTFTNKSFTFAAATHKLDVTGGALTFTSASPLHPLAISSNGPTTLTKTGVGEVVFEHAVQTNFTGTNRLEAGIWTLAVSERLADASALVIAGGTLLLPGTSETVARVQLTGGSIIGLGNATITAAGGFEVSNGWVNLALAGGGGLIKSGAGAVALDGTNTYTGGTTVQAGTLSLAPPAQAAALGGSGIDIVSGRVVFRHGPASPAASIAAILDAGFDLGFASGTLRSTGAGDGRGLGWRDDGTAVTVASTYYGDATLDLKVDFDDLLAVAQNYGRTGIWATGDFSYDGLVDFDDLLALAQSYGKNASAAIAAEAGTAAGFEAGFAADWALAQSLVPEPAMLFLLPLALCRRRRPVASPASVAPKPKARKPPIEPENPR